MDLWQSKNCRSILSPIKHIVLLGIATQCLADPDLKQPAYVNHFISPFSKDLALVDKFSQKKTTIRKESPKPDIDLRFGASISQEKVGSFLYKAIDNPKKFLENAAATTIFTGLEAIGVSESVKQGIRYIKEKTRYKFGKCGKIKLTNKVRAESCLTDRSSIELQSNYNLNSVTVSFKWSL